MSLVRPETRIGLLAPEAVIPPGELVTVYDVIAVPPVYAGAPNETLAWPSPAVALPIVGAPGDVGV